MWVASVYVGSECVCAHSVCYSVCCSVCCFVCVHTRLFVFVCDTLTTCTHYIYIYVYTLISLCVCALPYLSHTPCICIHTPILVCALQPLHPPTHLFSRENRNHSCAKWLFVCRVMYVLECVGMCWSVWWSVAACCRALQCSIESHKLKHIYTPSHTHTRAHTHTHTHTHARTNI